MIQQCWVGGEPFMCKLSGMYAALVFPSTEVSLSDFRWLLLSENKIKKKTLSSRNPRDADNEVLPTPRVHSHPSRKEGKRGSQNWEAIGNLILQLTGSSDIWAVMGCSWKEIYFLYLDYWTVMLIFASSRNNLCRGREQ